MRKDPIIFEDWELGSSRYFNQRILVLADFLLTFLISVMGIYQAVVNEVFTYLFLWTFVIIIGVGLEIFADQSSRSTSSRVSMTIGLTILHLLSTPTSNSNLAFSVIGGVLLMLKFSYIPLQGFVTQFFTEILLPKSDAVQLVLNEHIARMSETDYRVETQEEFQSRIRFYLNSMLKILVPAILISGISGAAFLLYPAIGRILVLLVVGTSGLIFAYTSITWYLDQWLSRRSTLKSRDIGEDPIFPEQLE